MLHCSVSLGLVSLEIIEALRERAVGVEVAARCGTEQDAQRILGGWRELQRVVIERCDDSVTRTAREPLRLLERVQQLHRSFDDEAYHLSHQFGELGWIMVRE